MIEINNLTKRYGAFTAVDDLSFQVGQGQVLGFLGPNGAGKSTTMKIVAGFLAPTSGSVSVCGFDVETDPIGAKQCMGYLPEGAPSYGEMTPQTFLDFIADVRGLKGSSKTSSLGDTIERLNLGEVLHQPIDTLSKGFKRRVGLAQAIVHDPKVLILDEPTDGLDPNQKHEVRQLIEDMSSDKIIVISTHILEEVYAVCDRAIIIARGRILADATPRELEEKSSYHNAVSIKGGDLAALVPALESLPQVEKVRQEDGTVTAFPQPGLSLYEPISQMLKSQNLSVESLAVERGRLDEVFRNITMTGAEALT